MDLGETFDQAVQREMKEELGISAPAKHIYDYWWRSAVETEFVRTYICIYDGPINVDPNEIDDGRFWSKEEIEETIGTGAFTPGFEWQYQKYLQWELSIIPIY